jgi:hypothetical protein
MLGDEVGPESLHQLVVASRASSASASVAGTPTVASMVSRPLPAFGLAGVGLRDDPSRAACSTAATALCTTAAAIAETVLETRASDRAHPEREWWLRGGRSPSSPSIPTATPGRRRLYAFTVGAQIPASARWWSSSPPMACFASGERPSFARRVVDHVVAAGVAKGEVHVEPEPPSITQRLTHESEHQSRGCARPRAREP